MIIVHHGLEVVLPDFWWRDAGMENFAPSSPAYCSHLSDTSQQVFEICISDIGPVERSPGIGIFNDNHEATARDRVVRILIGFRSGSSIPPVEIVEEPAGSAHRFKLTSGCHRFYCSLAASFTHVPAVRGSDIRTLDR